MSDGESKTEAAIFLIEARPLSLTLETLYPLEAYPGILQPITADNLQAVTNDMDSTRPIYYTLQHKPKNGLLVMVLNNGTETEVTSFSQDDLANKRVLYHHTSSMIGWTDEDSFIFEVSTMYADRISHKTFPIEISYDYVNEHNRDQLIKVTPLVVDEGGTIELTKNNLDISKIRRRLSTDGDSAPDVSLTITQLPDHGSLKLNKTDVEISDQITQRDINKKLVTYTHDDSDTEIDAFQFSFAVERPGSVSEGGSNFDTMFPIEIKPKNDQPFRLLIDEPSIELVQGFMCNITEASLNTEDDDTPPSGIQYVLRTGPHYGLIVNSDQIDEPITKFTQQDINDHKIWYLHNGSRNKDSFYFKVSDGKHKATYKVFVINVHPLTLEVIINKHLDIQQGLFSQYLTAETFNITTNGDKTRVMYNITKPPRNGELYMNNLIVRQFNHQNVMNQEVTYLQSDDTKSGDEFELTIYDSHNVVRSKMLLMRVIADLKKGEMSPEVPAGQPLVLTLDMLDASHLASITQSNPVYSVTEGPRLGHIYVTNQISRRYRRQDEVDDYHHAIYRRDANNDPAELVRFTHEDIRDGVVQYEPEDSTIRAPETDSFSFILKATAAQPAHGSFEVTVLPSKTFPTTPKPAGGAPTPDPDKGESNSDDAAEPKGAEDKSKKANDHLMIVYIVSAITVGIIALIVIIKCVKHKKKKKKQRLEAMKEDSKTPLSQPGVQVDPDMGYTTQDTMMSARSHGSELGPRIPTINVTPDSEAGSLGSRSSSSNSKTLPKHPQEYGSVSRYPGAQQQHSGGRPDVIMSKPPPAPRSKSPPKSPDPRYMDSRTVPTCKVTPLADGEEYDGSLPPGMDPDKPEVGFDWDNVDPELLQHCRTTNPVLHENKYWV